MASFNEIIHMVHNGEIPECLAATLDELINRTVSRFRHARRLMRKHRYEGIDGHKAEHRELLKSATELQQPLLQVGEGVAEELIAFLERWLTRHVLTVDRRMGAFLAQRR